VLIVDELLVERAADPWAPPCTWPSTISGLMTLPQSWATTYLRSRDPRPSRSTWRRRLDRARPRDGGNVVAGGRLEVGGRHAARAKVEADAWMTWRARRPSRARPGPTAAVSIAMSSGRPREPRGGAESFARTAVAASWTYAAAVTALRLAKCPAGRPPRRCRAHTVTQSSGTPSASAATWRTGLVALPAEAAPWRP